MDNKDYSQCEDLFTIQLRELVRIDELYNNSEDLYHNKIGTLYDEFNIEIPLRFERDYGWLWSVETIEGVKEAAEQAASILNEVRLRPKPYEPRSSEDIRLHLKAIEKAMISDMLDKLVECACPIS